MCHDYEFRTHIVKTNKQREFERKLKQDNIAEGYTCLTCCNTKQAVGPKLLCELVSVFQSKDGSSIGDSISSEGMNTINQLVPFRSMVSWIGRQIDPTQRKVDYSANVMEQIYQGIVKDIPGLNSGVPTRKNPYTGQDIKSDFPLLNSWNPYRVTQDMGYGNTTGMNVEQRQMQKGLPETERAGFRAGVMQQKGLERLADKEKEQLKSAEGQTKTLSNGKVYAKVGDKYETFDSQEKADVAIFKDEFKKSDKKSAVKGDTYFYKKKNGDVVLNQKPSMTGSKQMPGLILKWIEPTKQKI